jgi:hypothetical protein
VLFDILATFLPDFPLYFFSLPSSFQTEGKKDMRKLKLHFCIVFDESQICKNSLTLRKPRRGRVDNIKMHHAETGWGSKDWTDLAQDWDR